MPDYFCSYFDHRYAAKALVMWRSLKRHHPSAVLHVLCLSDACREILAALRLGDVHLHPLADVEAFYPELAEARENRTQVEYYFTLTPYLPAYLLTKHPEMQRLSFVDADLFFLGDPRAVLDEIGDASIGLSEHRFPEELAYLEPYGRFNDGWLTFRNEPAAHQALASWRAQCLEWCYDRLEHGRFAEQKYLDAWPSQFPVHVIEHPGANVAPWNLNRFPMSLLGNRFHVAGQPLIFFHAHGFKPAGPGIKRDGNLARYGVELSPLLAQLFERYEQDLLAAIGDIAVPLVLTLSSDSARDAFARFDDVKRRAESLEQQVPLLEADRAARLALIDDLQVRLDSSERDRTDRLTLIQDLQARLDSSERDRADRLTLIEDLQGRLDSSERDRADRLTLIEDLQVRLDSSETDRAARLELIDELQRRLDASEADRRARLDLIGSLQHHLDASESDRTARLDVIHALQTRLDAIEADRAAHLEMIHTLSRQAEDLQAQREDQARELSALSIQLENARGRLAAIQQSRSWRWTHPMRLLGALLQRNP
jgi:hypothetical protein